MLKILVRSCNYPFRPGDFEKGVDAACASQLQTITPQAHSSSLARYPSSYAQVPRQDGDGSASLDQGERCAIAFACKGCLQIYDLMLLSL